MLWKTFAKILAEKKTKITSHTEEALYYKQLWLKVSFCLSLSRTCTASNAMQAWNSYALFWFCLSQAWPARGYLTEMLIKSTGYNLKRFFTILLYFKPIFLQNKEKTWINSIIYTWRTSMNLWCSGAPVDLVHFSLKSFSKILP